MTVHLRGRARVADDGVQVAAHHDGHGQVVAPLRHLRQLRHAPVHACVHAVQQWILSPLYLGRRKCALPFPSSHRLLGR